MPRSKSPDALGLIEPIFHTLFVYTLIEYTQSLHDQYAIDRCQRKNNQSFVENDKKKLDRKRESRKGSVKWNGEWAYQKQTKVDIL